MSILTDSGDVEGPPGSPPKKSDVTRRPSPPNHPWGGRNTLALITWRPAEMDGWTNNKVQVVVARIHPMEEIGVKEQHSWPWSSHVVSILDPSWATLGQYRTVPSGETAIQDGT